MILRFTSAAKELKKAAGATSLQPLQRLYPQNAEQIYNALVLLSRVQNLAEVLPFRMYRPHELKGDEKGFFSLTVGGRKRLIVRTLGADGKATREIDYESEYGLIVEVSEHYGD